MNAVILPLSNVSTESCLINQAQQKLYLTTKNQQLGHTLICITTLLPMQKISTPNSGVLCCSHPCP
jgi:hypothetical protein